MGHRFAILLVAIVAALSRSAGAFCTSPIYCTGPLLDTIQRAGLFNDSKTFVDMPLRAPEQVILAAFAALGHGPLSRAQLANFVEQYFYPAGTDILEMSPIDWKPNPSFLLDIVDPELNRFASAIHRKWQDLTRRWNPTVVSSHIVVENPFVVAGGRFREYYYWDSKWIIDGLLVSEMYYTAKGMLLNMLSIIDEYGFMPNGGRIYYLNRSQPPLLTSMIHQYYTKTQDTDLLARALPTLDKEYHWWMTNRSVVVELGSRSFMLNLFNVTNDTPRPESYSEDFHVAHSLPTQHAQDLFYANIAGGAETGWDFSTRWFGPTNVLGSIQVSDIVPVDLNSIMYVNEVLLSHFHFLVGDKNGMSKFYYHQAMSRLDAIRNVFWDQSRSQWIDYDWKERKPRNDKSFYVSNIMPLWASAAHNVANTSAIEGILNALKIPLSFPGGVPTSLQPSGQQWDFPNAWPPLQSFMLKALEAMAPMSPKAASLGRDLVYKWVLNNYCAWNETRSHGGYMFEKYDATRVGLPGGGGEYEVQEGFGWTNGVMLELLASHGKWLRLNHTCTELATRFNSRKH